jgi:transcriptional regulator with XRE-family HTH domain
MSMTSPPLDENLVTALRRVSGWDQARIAAEIGVNRSTVTRYENGSTRNIPGPVQRLLRDLIERDIAAVSPPSPAAEPASALAESSAGAGADGACSTVFVAVEQGGA